MENDYGLLGDDEVLFVQSGRIIMANPTFKVSEFLDALAQLISEQEPEWSDEREGWFNDRGQSCEVLRFSNQGWQRGRVRIRLEFCPEQPPKLLREADSYRDEYQDSYQDNYQTEETGREIPYLPRRKEDAYGREDYRDDYRNQPLDDLSADDY